MTVARQAGQYDVGDLRAMAEEIERSCAIREALKREILLAFGLPEAAFRSPPADATRSAAYSRGPSAMVTASTSTSASEDS